MSPYCLHIVIILTQGRMNQPTNERMKWERGKSERDRREWMPVELARQPNLTHHPHTWCLKLHFWAQTRQVDQNGLGRHENRFDGALHKKSHSFLFAHSSAGFGFSDVRTYLRTHTYTHNPIHDLRPLDQRGTFGQCTSHVPTFEWHCNEENSNQSRQRAPVIGHVGAPSNDLPIWFQLNNQLFTAARLDHISKHHES